MKQMKVIKAILNITLIILNIAASIILIKKLQEDKELFERDIAPEE